MYKKGFNDPTTAEAYVLYLTLEFPAQCSFLEVIFESDNEKIIRVLSRKEEIPNLYVGNMIKGIQ